MLKKGGGLTLIGHFFELCLYHQIFRPNDNTKIRIAYSLKKLKPYGFSIDIHMYIKFLSEIML